jgi:endonuclease/exonuclease/phosphatase family metal-dependent hydrolase
MPYLGRMARWPQAKQMQRLRASETARVFLRYAESAIVVLFFLQSLRFLIGGLYSRLAATAAAIGLPAGPAGTAADATAELGNAPADLLFVGLMLTLPLLGVLVGRVRWMMVVATFLVITGRLLMTAPAIDASPLLSSGLAVGAGLLFLTLLIQQRARDFPIAMILALATDQILRAIGNTTDPTLGVGWWPPMLAAGLAAFLAGALSVLLARTDARRPAGSIDLDRGIIGPWGGIGLGALLFLEVTLLALPNAMAGRTGAAYPFLASAALAATLLPLIPFVRAQARRLIGAFAGMTRGAVWGLVLVILLIIALRIQSITLGSLLIPTGGIALILLQLLVSLIWWWLARPQAEGETNLTGIWVLLGAALFTILITADTFTYEYAFVFSESAPAWLVTLLRGMRGMGIAILMFATLLAVMPMLMTTQRIPWPRGTRPVTVIGTAVIAGLTALTALIAAPPLTTALASPPTLRIATFNINSAFNPAFAQDLDGLAQTIAVSGADIVLLQEVDRGRATSFGVDQALWLARHLGMDSRSFATDEGLHGLAVLSRTPFVYDDGQLLTSPGRQNGLQRVQVMPDNAVLTLYNTQLAQLLAGDSIAEQERQQRAQLEEVIGTIFYDIEADYNGQAGRLVLGGTFNNVPDSPLMQSLFAVGFQDPFAGTNLDLSATLVSGGLRARVDYVLPYGQLLPSAGTGVIDSSVSDHRLAFIEVLLRP